MSQSGLEINSNSFCPHYCHIMQNVNVSKVTVITQKQLIVKYLEFLVQGLVLKLGHIYRIRKLLYILEIYILVIMIYNYQHSKMSIAVTFIFLGGFYLCIKSHSFYVSYVEKYCPLRRTIFNAIYQTFTNNRIIVVSISVFLAYFNLTTVESVYHISLLQDNPNFLLY